MISRFALLLIVALVSATAATPRLTSVTPPGAQRGSELELRLDGARLDNSPEVVFATPGIEVVKMNQVRTNTLKALVRVAPDCAIGEHQLRVRTATGVSELRTFWISAYTNLTELETNNTAATAHRVLLGVTINGRSGGEDVDYFRVTAKGGQRISAEVEAIRLGRAMLDAFLAIRDSEGNVLASVDDTTLLMQDAFVSVLAPKDGHYTIEMRDGTYSGNETPYRLQIGSFPRPAMIYPLGGKAGEKVSFQFIGAAGGEFVQEVTLPKAADDRFGVFAEQDGAAAPSPNWIRVSEFDNELEQEPNDTRAAATSYYGPLPVAFNGIITKKGEEDWFRFTAKKGQALDVTVFARRLRSPLDSVISIHDAKGNRVEGNDDAGGADSAAKFTAPADGEYFLRVRDQFEQGGPDYAYRVEITPQQPSVTLNIPQVARNDSQSRQFITVPRGGRFATMMLARRANFSGDLQFEVPDLPEGVKLVADTLAGKQDQQPLVFEAAADAAIGGRFVNILAKPTDTGKSAKSRFVHDVDFISGPNQTFYYQTREEKLYLAVCESAPFSIRIEEPKAPLVSFGALDVQVIAERRSGFNEAINVKMMWNPPGVGSLPDITIPKGSNAVVYQLNAKGEVEPRKWRIAMLGSANVNGGPLFVSSQLATLETAQPYVVGTVAPVVVSPGQEAKLVCKLDQRKPFAGKARVHVIGLPEKITASEAFITSEDKEVTIQLSVDSTAPLGSIRNFLCAADVVENGQVIPHNLAAGAVIRVVPPKKGAAKQVAAK